MSRFYFGPVLLSNVIYRDRLYGSIAQRFHFVDASHGDDRRSAVSQINVCKYSK